MSLILWLYVDENMSSTKFSLMGSKRVSGKRDLRFGGNFCKKEKGDKKEMRGMEGRNHSRACGCGTNRVIFLASVGEYQRYLWACVALRTTNDRQSIWLRLHITFYTLFFSRFPLYLQYSPDVEAFYFLSIHIFLHLARALSLRTVFFRE